MNENEDWIMAPVIAGLCQYESLLDGTLDLFDVARMNDALTVKAENEARAIEAAKQGR